MLPAGAAVVVLLSIDALLKGTRIFKLDLGVSSWKVAYSTMRTHAAFAYVASFHLVRYYLIRFLIFGLAYIPSGSSASLFFYFPPSGATV